MNPEVVAPYKKSLLIENKTPDAKKQFVEWDKDILNKERDSTKYNNSDMTSPYIEEVLVNNDQIIFDITKYLECQHEFISKCNMPKLFDIIKNNITIEPEDNEEDDEDEDMDLFDDFY